MISFKKITKFIFVSIVLFSFFNPSIVISAPYEKTASESVSSFLDRTRTSNIESLELVLER